MNHGAQRERAATVELGTPVYPGSYNFAFDDDFAAKKSNSNNAQQGDFLGEIFCKRQTDEISEEASRIQLISKWTPEEVGVWLNCVNFGEHRQAFMANDIGGIELLNLPSNKDYLAELRVKKLSERIRLLELIACLRSGDVEKMMTLSMTPIVPTRPDESPINKHRSLVAANDGTLWGALLKKYTDRQLQVLMTKESDCFKAFAHYIVFITLVMFTIAALILICMWAFFAKVEAFVGTFFVASIAATAYYCKSQHLGDVVISGKTVPVVRYVDWITTTPIMLYEICHIAHTDFQTTFMIVGCDLLMLIFGIASALFDHHLSEAKAVMFVLSCIFYIFMVATINVDVVEFAEEQSPEVQRLFERLEVLTIIVWSFYPFVVLLGGAHAGLITKSQETCMLCILDMTAKIGMEGLIVAHAVAYHSNSGTSYGSSSYASYSAYSS